MGVYHVRVTRKRRSDSKARERTTKCRHPCQNLSANPFADQGLIAAPWTPASLSPFRRCCYFGKSENPGLDAAAVMGVPFVSPQSAVSRAIVYKNQFRLHLFQGQKRLVQRFQEPRQILPLIINWDDDAEFH